MKANLTNVALSGTVWTLSGNAIGVNDFLGTTNAQPLVFRTNNTERLRILSAVSSTGALVFINGGDAVINGMTVGRGSGQINTNIAI